VAVDEKGTEAAATAVSGIPVPCCRSVLMVDRPFIFICDLTEQILTADRNNRFSPPARLATP
jgi:serine protease inhibitor